MPHFKNQLRNVLRDKKHLYGIILVHLTSNVALRIRKHFTGGWIQKKFFFNCHNSKFCPPHSPTHPPTHSLTHPPTYSLTNPPTLTHSPTHPRTHSLTYSLTTFTSLKWSSTRPPFYATITNSPEGYAFWGSKECVPSAPCLFFYLQSGCLSSSSSNETISRCWFSVSALSWSSIIDTTKLFKALRLRYCLLYRGTILDSYLFVIDLKITPILYILRIINLDHDDHAPFMLAVFVTTHLQVGRLTQDTLIIKRNHDDHTPLWANTHLGRLTRDTLIQQSP